jgi:uncharacterized protein (DUF983 family)
MPEPQPRDTRAQAAPPPRGSLRWLAAALGAVLWQRCPRCWQGRMFRGTFAMNDPCPVCGLLFQREEGYFLGAMYFSTALSTVLVGAFYIGLSLLFPAWDGLVVAAVSLALYLPLTPAVFRWSRVLWVWFDRGVCPTDLDAGSYEKSRRTRM